MCVYKAPNDGGQSLDGKRRGAGYRPGTGRCSSQVMDSNTEPQGVQEFYIGNWAFQLL